ncbi:MAG: ArnT family glycosyltransferase [Anaerolineales bacterium]
MEFKEDEAFNLMKARELSELKSFPTRSGVSSTGIPEPPVFMYLLSVPIVISDDAVFVTGWIALFNVIGVFLCYLLVRRHISASTALITASFFAISPWQVLFSRKIWTQNLVPPFILLFLLLLFEAVFRNRPHFIVYAIMLLSICLQLHISAVFMVIFMLILTIWQRRNINMKYLGIGVLLALLLFTPYFFDIIISDFEALLAAYARVNAAFVLRSKGITLPLQLVTTNGFEYSLGSSYGDFIQSAPRLSVMDITMMFLCILGLGMAVFSPSSVQRSLALYTSLGLGFFIIINTELYPHYFNALLPILFILCALPIAYLFEHVKSSWKWITYLGLATILIYQFSFTFSFLDFIHRSNCIEGDYGPPYRAHLDRVIETIEDLKVSGLPIDLDIVQEYSRSCEKWDLAATQYLLERVETK